MSRFETVIFWIGVIHVLVSLTTMPTVVSIVMLLGLGLIVITDKKSKLRQQVKAAIRIRQEERDRRGKP